MNFAPDIFAGRSAVVTGGATGIGWYIVRMLGGLGANVGIVSRKEENLVRASEQFKAEDGIRDTRLSRGLGDVYKRQLIYVIRADDFFFS